MNSSDQTIMYYQKLAFKVAMVLILVGALNWLLVGAFGVNAVEMVFGRRSYTSRAVYIVVGISALLIAFNRDTYLPFLGETVLPCQIFSNYIPQGATLEVKVDVAPGAKVLYWAAEPSNEHLKHTNNWSQAYLKYENAGVTTADENGAAILKVRPPQAYTVPFKGKLSPHIHFRICSGNGMLSRIKTVFVEDGRIEGFRDY
jgi:uncharacterized membrane protein YuzA (DUF378 family)